MQARPATPSDLAKVFRRNAERMIEEYATAGVSTRAAKDIMLAEVNAGRGHALVTNGQTVAVIVWQPYNGAVFTSFAAQNSFFTASTVRFCKRHIREIQALCGNAILHSQSFSRHPQVERWFRALGFVRDRQQEGGGVVYTLSPTE
ncbi:hypothetical protein GOC68_22860 [Sinorhizobium medicae]|nr:hypothetical protein [Sinorhizobium medicae]